MVQNSFKTQFATRRHGSGSATITIGCGRGSVFPTTGRDAWRQCVYDQGCGAVQGKAQNFLLLCCRWSTRQSFQTGLCDLKQGMDFALVVAAAAAATAAAAGTAGRPDGHSLDPLPKGLLLLP